MLFSDKKNKETERFVSFLDEKGAQVAEAIPRGTQW